MRLHDRLDLRRCGEACVPYRLRVRLAKPIDEIAQASVGDHRDVGGGVSRVDQSAPVAVEDDDRLAARGEQIGRSQSGDAAANHNNIGIEVAVDRSRRGDRR
jgi:hypothetical protein